MKGKGIYFAISGLFGILCSLVDFLPFFVLLILYLLILYRFKSFSSQYIVFLVFLFVVFYIAGAGTAKNNHSSFRGDEKTFAVLIQQSEIDGDLLKITGLETKMKEKVMVQYKIRSIAEKQRLKRKRLSGCECVISGTLTSPPESRNPNAFNYRNYLLSKKIHWIIAATQFSLDACHRSKPSIGTMIENLRVQGAEYVQANFPEPLASLAVALLFGTRSFMSESLVASYQKIGIVHLLAISGLQVTFLTGVLYYCGLRLGVIREKMILALLVFLPFYAVLTGASPSVVRAVLMMFLLLLGLRFFHNRIAPLDALCGAFLLCLFFSPYLIFDVGFQLSFAACTALLLSSGRIVANRAGISQIILSTYVAQLATLPILLFHFYEFSLLTLIANFMFVPFFSVLLTPFVFFTFILHPFLPGFINPLLWMVNKLVLIANFLIEMLAELPHQMLTPGRPDSFFLPLYIIAILLIFYKLEASPNKLRVYLYIFLPLFLHLGYNWLSPLGEVTFIDVGQGDAILIKLPFHQGTYLIDSGGTIPMAKENWQKKHSSFEVGEDVVVPFLKSKGIVAIDKLILTHGDYDHIGGAKAIIEHFRVKEVMVPKVENYSALLIEIMNAAVKKEIPISFVDEGDGWKQGKFVFHVLSPNDGGEKQDGNNESIIVHAKIGGLTWLFTGDAEAEKEAVLSAKYPMLDVDVLKVGHHGSKSSTTEQMLDRFQPEIAVISVGEKNRYGHPDMEIISRLEKRGIHILRTDRNGAINYIFRGEKGTFLPHIP
jgi:competence protein ComEC